MTKRLTFAAVTLLTGGILSMTHAATHDKTTSVPTTQLCLGGLDHKLVSELPQALEEAGNELPKFRTAGMTSHESYVRWSMFEPADGTFDFSYWDAYLDQHKKNGVQWVPFLLVGPAYTLPKWFYKSPRHHGYVCLEHGQECDIQSLWNPDLRPLVKRAVTAFGKHFEGNKTLESVILGITGNYGESIYPASGLDWTQDLNGDYHTHSGWWLGDKYAVKDFQNYSKKRYKTIEDANRDWGTTYTAWDQAKPLLPADWPTSAGLMHQALWSQDAMNEWSDFWMKTTKEAMPSTDVYLVTGGHAPAWHGLDISAQTKLAAADKCGVRITNESDRYAQNFVITRMVSSAAKLYGAFFSYEPAGLVTEKGIASRIFNAISSGARTLHWYTDNLMGTPERAAAWERLRGFAVDRPPAVVDVAVFYPRRWMNLRGDPELAEMYDDFVGLRNAFDYEFVDELMMDDMVSSRIQPFRYLLLRDDFVEDGVTTKAVDRFLAQKNAPRVIRFSKGDAAGTTGTKFVAQLSQQVHPNDDFTTGVYFTRFKDGSVLFLNERPEEIDLSKTHPKMVKAPTRVPAYSLTEVKD